MKTANYNLTGPARKELVQAIEKIKGVKAVYKKAPTFEYVAGDFTIDKNGCVFCEEDVDLKELIAKLMEQGFTPEEEVNMEEERTGIAIQMPMIDGDSLSRLEQLIASKETLIKKAIGADDLMVAEKDGKLDFPWFKEDATPDEMHAYMLFVTALVNKAGKAKRVTAKDHPVDNEKYAFRCFLLSLGMIGETYKKTRKILLKNFTGSSAFKTVPKEASDEISE